MAHAWREHIVADSQVMLGKPVVRGTRITVELILEKLAAGETVDDLLVAYPRLARDDVQAALAYAAETLRSETMYRRACPDMRLTVEELVAEGDAVVVRWTLTGTHLGEYDGIAPTNKAIKTTGITIYHFANGKIVDDRYESSGLSLHDQLLGRLVDQPPI